MTTQNNTITTSKTLKHGYKSSKLFKNISDVFYSDSSKKFVSYIRVTVSVDKIRHVTLYPYYDLKRRKRAIESAQNYLKNYFPTKPTKGKTKYVPSTTITLEKNLYDIQNPDGRLSYIKVAKMEDGFQTTQLFEYYGEDTKPNAIKLAKEFLKSITPKKIKYSK